MFVREWGNGDKYAILIHGLANSSLAWHKLAKDLVDLGYHVIAPDLSGHGKSARKNSYSMEEWSQDILDLGYREPDLLIGHSMGGLIAANIEATIGAKKTILLDPVFRFPSSRLLSWSVRNIFGHIMKGTLAFHRANKKWAKRDSHILYASIRQWDSMTTTALKNSAKTVSSFLATKGHVLLIRAKGSYIVPSNISKKMMGENTKFFYINSGHNLHLDSYKEFFVTLNDFITPPKVVSIAK